MNIDSKRPTDEEIETAVQEFDLLAEALNEETNEHGVPDPEHICVSLMAQILSIVDENADWSEHLRNKYPGWEKEDLVRFLERLRAY